MTRRLTETGSEGDASLNLEILDDCCLCEEPVKTHEPFLLAFARQRGGALVNVPYHLSCLIRETAEQVADEIEEDDETQDELAPAVSRQLKRR